LSDPGRLRALAEAGLGAVADPRMERIAERVRRRLRVPVALVRFEAQVERTRRDALEGALSGQYCAPCPPSVLSRPCLTAMARGSRPCRGAPMRVGGPVDGGHDRAGGRWRPTMVDTVAAPRLMSSAHQPVPVAATRIRRRLRALLVGWGLGAETVDDALLVVEELVANAMDHARSPFEVVVRLTGDVLHVGVRDGSRRKPQVRPFEPHAVRGRGLQLVATLSRRWGCELHADGKTVWAELRT
jgi:anti-sigma regulatory factor (Ser/Thr protein kinase)